MEREKYIGKCIQGEGSTACNGGGNALTFVQGACVQIVGYFLNAQAREAPRDLDHRKDEVDDGTDVQQLVPGLVSDQLLASTGRTLTMMGQGNKEAGAHSAGRTRHTTLFLRVFQS